MLTVKYPSEVRWNQPSRGRGDERAEEEENGCDADVTVCATNRLAGPGDDAKVNFTFEVRKRRGRGVLREGGREGGRGRIKNTF